MINIPKWKVILIILACFMGFAYSAPNLLPTQTLESIRSSAPSWFPNKTINLGLDLQGGAHLLVEADIESVIEERMNSLQDNVRETLRDIDIRTAGRVQKSKDDVTLRLENSSQQDAAITALRKIESGLEVTADESATLKVFYTEEALMDIKDKVIQQSIEVIRRRVDETGTKEPNIQRQGEDRIIIQLPGVEDPEEIKKLLQKTAKMTFHLVSEDLRGGIGTTTYPMVETKNRMPLRVKTRAEITGDMLTNASTGFDQNSRPVVNFQLNSIGAKRFCKVSSENIGRRFAIVLDEEIISAPEFKASICAGQAQISGNFDVASANELALLLRAGALPADLKFVEERSVGPSLGADSIEAGKKASLIALTLVLIFMVIKYRRFGIYADVALVVNVALIFALLSMLQATLTLPGIAGIVLTIGMAVDANVLIFERIKEEFKNGRTPVTAVDVGYSRAFGTIMDANLTTLIAAAILYSFGTGPIKGFAVTLGLGVLTSLFTAIMVTRLFVVWWLRSKKPNKIEM